MFDVRLRFSLLAAACALSWTMFGCATSSKQSSSDQQTAVLYDKDKVVCTRDYPTGSHIPRTRCYRRNQAQQRRDADQAQIDAIKLGGAMDVTPSDGSGGGRN
jgi:hypothetical protein